MAETGSWTDGDVLDDVTEFRLNDMEAFFDGDGALSGLWTLGVTPGKGVSLAAIVGHGFAGEAHIPKVYDARAVEIARSGRETFVLLCDRTFINALNRNPEGLVSDLSLGAPIRAETLDLKPTEIEPPTEPIVVPAGTAVMAVIDNGIAIGHELFRRGPETSRVEFAWVMDAAPVAAGSPASIGRQFDREAIEIALAASTQDGLLDEDRFYRLVGLVAPKAGRIEPVAWRRSHGTHVMGLAAGAPMDAQVVNRPIISVDLPSRDATDPSGVDLTESVRLALEFIIARARLFRIGAADGPPPPLIVNFSYGNFAGPHDGAGKVESLIRQAIARAQAQGLTIRVVLPSGNGNLSRCHAETCFEAVGDSLDLDWRIQPDDRSASHVEIWMPCVEDQPSDGDEPGLVEVTATLPDGARSGPATTRIGSAVDILNAAGRKVGRLSYKFRKGRTRRGRFVVMLFPTASFARPGRVAPSGLCRIQVTNGTLAPHQPVRVWVRRDETLPGFPEFGRQSYFDNACYRRFDARGAPLASDPAQDDCPVRRTGTLSGFATGDQPIVIGGFVESTGVMADYSATGPGAPLCGVADSQRPGPDGAAVSDDSPVLSGVLSAGSRCGSYAAMNGTSVAAPQAARWVATQAAAALASDRHAVRSFAAGTNAQFPGDPPASSRAGGGRMKLPFRIGPAR